MWMGFWFGVVCPDQYLKHGWMNLIKTINGNLNHDMNCQTASITMIDFKHLSYVHLNLYCILCCVYYYAPFDQ